MITDKDISDARIIIDMVGGNSIQWREVRDFISRIRTESAEQARKEAAERVSELAGKDCFRNPGYGEGYERGLYDAYLAILGDSVVKENLITDHIPDTGEKLAIAVKALDLIQKRGTYNTLKGRTLSGEMIDSKTIINEYGIIARDALKEIQ